MGVKCYFVILNSILTPFNNIFALMVDVILIIHRFLLKNIIKLTKYEMKYNR